MKLMFMQSLLKINEIDSSLPPQNIKNFRLKLCVKKIKNLSQIFYLKEKLRPHGIYFIPQKFFLRQHCEAF
jgi:hypothetical protein